MNPDLVKVLLLVLGVLLSIVVTLLGNIFFLHVNQRKKLSTIALGVVTGILAVLVADALKEPQANINTYTILGVGYCYCMGVIALFMKAWHPKPPEDDRTTCLGLPYLILINSLQIREIQ